jgi:5,10-methylenetetrahydromethanopterin reductase
VASLGLAGAPAASRLAWLSPSVPKVPVDVVATGPKVIAVGARVADRLTFAVGADPDRVRWAVATARQARADAGLDAGAISLGAYVNVVAHPDADEARRLISGGLTSFARFSAMHGTVAGPASEEDRHVMLDVQRSYDMGGHFRHGSPQSAALTDEFVDRFGVAGPPERCVERLRLLLDLGLERLVVVGPALGADREESARAMGCFVDEVMPALRSPPSG